MKTLPGRCANEMFCSLGASAKLVQVPGDHPFICPMCSKALTPPTLKRRQWERGAAVFGISATLLVTTAFVLGISLAAMPILRGGHRALASHTGKLMAPYNGNVIAAKCIANVCQTPLAALDSPAAHKIKSPLAAPAKKRRAVRTVS